MSHSNHTRPEPKPGAEPKRWNAHAVRSHEWRRAERQHTREQKRAQP